MFWRRKNSNDPKDIVKVYCNICSGTGKFQGDWLEDDEYELCFQCSGRGWEKRRLFRRKKKIVLRNGEWY